MGIGLDSVENEAWRREWRGWKWRLEDGVDGGGRRFDDKGDGFGEFPAGRDDVSFHGNIPVVV